MFQAQKEQKLSGGKEQGASPGMKEARTQSMHVDGGRAKKAGRGLLALDHLGLSRAP